MEVVGTREAFLAVIRKRGIYKQLGVAKSTASNWRRLPDNVTLDKMEEILLRYGATVVQEKVWNVDGDASKT